MNGKREFSLGDWLRLLRPAQWTKNLVVIAAAFFAFWDRTQSFELIPSLLVVLAGTALFCIISSGVYILNDIRDVAADRRHPKKKDRPLAAGRIEIVPAGCLALCLLGAGCLGAARLSPHFALIVTAYVAIQTAYSCGLKRVALIDSFVIAGGFVLRAIAGAVVLNAEISPWLLLCTFLLALFLALCKRRHEKLLLNEDGGEHRPSLDGYDQRLLDQLIAVTASMTVVCYAIYTLWPDTTAKFGTSGLGFTIPFVIFGVFRYLDLVYRREKGGRPEKVLLTDGPTIVNLVLYALAVAVIVALG